MQGRAALITGGGSGIGADLAVQLARRGVSVTLADVDVAGAEAVAARIRAAGGQAIVARCDVADPAQHVAAFREHMGRFGRLDYALLNAGERCVRLGVVRSWGLLMGFVTALVTIMHLLPAVSPPATGIAERGDLITGRSDRWQQTLDVDLKAVSRLSLGAPVMVWLEGHGEPAPFVGQLAVAAWLVDRACLTGSVHCRCWRACGWRPVPC